MLGEIVTIVHSIAMTVLQLLPFMLVFGVVFAALSYFWPCNTGRPWWRNRGLLTDLGYWFFIPLVARYFRIGLLILGAAWLFGIHTTEGLAEFYADGHGPLARLPLWAQGLIFIVGADFLMYWFHRGFHRPMLWRFHAVHHSSEDLDWISAMRFHPINIFLGSVLADVVMLLAGISPQVLVFVGPFNIAHSVFVHANLNWTFGPFKYVIASPVFHRWHHTSVERGGQKNFAPTLPFLDLLFGTFYMPKNEVPDRYGVDEPMPMSFADQLLYPFKR